MSGSDGSKAVLKKSINPQADYSSLLHKLLDAMADKGTIAYNFFTMLEDKMRFKLKTEVTRVIIDNDDLWR